MPPAEWASRSFKAVCPHNLVPMLRQTVLDRLNRSLLRGTQLGGSRCTLAVRCTWCSWPLLAWLWRDSLGPGRKKPPAAPAELEPDCHQRGGCFGQEFDAKQMELIQKVTNYFNQMGDMKGNFVQTAQTTSACAGSSTSSARAVSLRIQSAEQADLSVSDGKYLAIQDLDLKTDNRWGLDQTPFRVLLRKDVDLLKEARILEVAETEDRIVLALQDKSPDTPGRIKLFLPRSRRWSSRNGSRRIPRAWTPVSNCKTSERPKT